MDFHFGTSYAITNEEDESRGFAAQWMISWASTSLTENTGFH